MGFQGSGQCQRLFHQAPASRTFSAVAGDPCDHFRIAGFSGSEVDHVQATGLRLVLGKGAFTGAGTAEDEFFHGKGLFLRRRCRDGNLLSLISGDCQNGSVVSAGRLFAASSGIVPPALSP
ncbi:hypothetical protein BN874_460065 [Candidatus Contendobacter odensis Run_B_J11]|uniref:Uncharacterized protein n=1 Tax=Candidatus Contendobacter odensis Run_B_J11 TaxID=1400861 RepID=A0A7U7GDU4_9GAMM|nr:hypothetical protein BN874_460065 [Candidatus Contendobacter odensis Run_B_J11]